MNKRSDYTSNRNIGDRVRESEREATTTKTKRCVRARATLAVEAHTKREKK